MIRHMIFDCDGVLVDSEPLSMRIDHELLSAHGLAISAEEVSRRYIGHTFAAMLKMVERDFGLTLPAGIEAEKNRRLDALYHTDLQPVAGVAAALAAITLPRSVASNSTLARIALALRLTGLAPHFGGRITSYEETEAGKPAPDVYLLAAKRANFAPQHCLAIEDSVTGVTAARAAGCRVLGFTGTYHTPVDQAAGLRAAGAERVISHMDELAGALAQFA